MIQLDSKDICRVSPTECNRYSLICDDQDDLALQGNGDPHKVAIHPKTVPISNSPSDYSVIRSQGYNIMHRYMFA